MADAIRRKMRSCWSLALVVRLAKKLQGDDGYELFCRKNLVGVFKDVPFPARLGDAGARGRGVFTTRPVKKGEVVTLYPCHMMRVRAPGSAPKFLSSRRISKAEAEALSDYGQFLYEAPDGKVYEAIGDPAHDFEAHACGHMINDPHPAAETICARPSSPEEVWRSILEYELRVAGPANCDLEILDGIGVLCVATRDIAEGEEVLAPYGFAYWCNLDASKIMEMFLEHGDRLKRERPREFQASCSVVKRYIAKLTSV